VRKLKPNAVVTLGCGGLLFFATFGILLEVAGKAVSLSNGRHDLVELDVKPGETSEWVARPKDVDAFAWDYSEALNDYLVAEEEFIDGSRVVSPINTNYDKPIARVRFTNKGKGIDAIIKVWYRKTIWNGR